MVTHMTQHYIYPVYTTTTTTTTTTSTTTTTATTTTSSSRQKLSSWGSQMIFLWPQKLHIVILYTPPDNIWRPDESETKNGKPTHPNIY